MYVVVVVVVINGILVQSSSLGVSTVDLGWGPGEVLEGDGGEEGVRRNWGGWI